MQVKQKVIILRKTRYGDNDLILNCLTPEGSRISFIARSALKSKKRFGGGVLEPTHYIQALYEDRNSGRGENTLLTLKEATLIQDFPGLRTDYARIEAALYFVSLVASVVKEGEVDSAEIFNLLGNTLKIAETSAHLDHLRTHFEVKLLANQGVLPLEGEESELLSIGIADHERAPLTHEDWLRLRGRVKRVLQEYLQIAAQESRQSP